MTPSMVDGWVWNYLTPLHIKCGSQHTDALAIAQGRAQRFDGEHNKGRSKKK